MGLTAAFPGWRVLALAVGQTLIWAAGYYSFPALVPAFEADLGWPRAQVMSVFTLALLASALGAPVAGALIDRGHGPRMLPLAAGMIGLGLIGASRAQGFAAFAAAWAVVGLAQAGALYEATFTLLTRVHGAAARAPITAITLVAGFAGTLSFPLCAALAAHGGWRFALLVLGLMSLLAVVPLMWRGAAGLTGAEADSPQAPNARPFLHRREFWALAGTFFLYSLYASAVIAHILPLLADRGVAAAATVVAASCIGPMQVAGRVAMLLLGRSRGETALVRISWLAILLGLPALGFAGAGLPVLAAFLLLHGAGIGTMSILRPLVNRAVLGGRGYGRMAGAIGGIAMLGTAIAPGFGALLHDLGGYDLMLGVLGALLLAGFGTLNWALARRAEPPLL